MTLPTSLAQDDALVLQTINDCGEEDFNGLAVSLRINRQRLAHSLERLTRQGLVIYRRSTAGPADVWVRLSSRGRQLMHSLWPEAVMTA